VQQKMQHCHQQKSNSQNHDLKVQDGGSEEGVARLKPFALGLQWHWLCSPSLVYKIGDDQSYCH